MRTFALLSEAVAFQARHPVLRTVTILLLIVPAFIRHVIARFLAIETPLLVPDTPAWEQPLLWATFLFLLLTSILELWGIGSVLVTGKRLLGHPAGRSRRSFMALISESVRLVPALFLTSVLRVCTIGLLLVPSILVGLFLLWKSMHVIVVAVVCVLLGIPAALYALQTSFYSIIIVGEDVAYRQALKRSREAVKGRALALTTVLLLLFAITLGPGMVLDAAMSAQIPTEELSARGIGADLVVSVADGVGTLLATLGVTILYSLLRSHTIQQASVPAPKKKKSVKKKSAK